MNIPEMLRALKAARGWTQEELADALEAGQSSVSRWLNGAAVPSGTTVERIQGLSKESGLIERQPAPMNQAPLVGRVGAGALIEVEYEQADAYDSIELPFSYPDPVVAFEVAGDSQLPVYEPGAVIVCLRDQVRATDHYLGMPVVVRLSTGERYLKRLARGSIKGRYNLESWNARTIEDVRIEWVGEVIATVSRTAIRHIERRAPAVARKPKPKKMASA